MKATTKQLNVLHGALNKYFLEYIEGAMEEGEEVSSGTLNAINAFLKNNNISADIVEADAGNDMHMKLLSLVEKEA